MTDPLITLCFTAGEAGILHAPAGSAVTFAPLGSAFFELRIALPNGTMVAAVLARTAVKVYRAGAKP
jgi:hypothetical protein